MMGFTLFVSSFEPVSLKGSPLSNGGPTGGQAA